MDVLKTPAVAAPREADVTEEDETGDAVNDGEYGEDDAEEEEEDDDDEDDEEDDGDEEDDDDEPHIEISDAFYDEHPSPEGPATAPWFQRHSQPQIHEGSGNPLWPDYEGDSTEHATAAFIGSYVYDGSECAASGAPRAGVGAGARAADVEQMKRDASACQPLAEFDFDGLPPRKTPRPSAAGAAAAAASATTRSPLTPRRSSFATTRPEDPSPGARVGRPAKTKADARACAKEEKAKSKSRSPSPSGSSMNASLKARKWWSWWWWQFVEWVQTMCSPENAVDVYEKESRLIGGYPFGAAPAGQYDAPRTSEGAKGKGGEMGVAALTAHVAGQPPANAPQPLNTRRRSRWREGLKKAYLAVPAFASPLTPVLNPLVGRAQWEIVVRSAAMALILSCVVVGSLLAVPE